MTDGLRAAGLSAILCSDWGKESRKRTVYVADTAALTVRRLAAREWPVDGIIEVAARLAPNGSVLVTFDAPLGVPVSYLAAAARVRSWRPPQTFLIYSSDPDCGVSMGTEEP